MIKTLIVEDDNLNVVLLKALLDKYCPEIQVIAVAKNSEEFVDLFFNKLPELLLLDIHLGDKDNALDTLAELDDVNCEIIVISSDDSHAIKAINQYRVAGYVTKPVNIIQLKRVITTAVKSIQLKRTLENSSNGLSDKLVAISTTKSIEFLLVKDILYLEADGKYTVFHLVNGTTKVVSKNIGEYEKILPCQIFFRIHHKYIVNLQKVQNINKSDGSYCQLIDGKSLSIAKRRQDSLRKFLQL